MSAMQPALAQEVRVSAVALPVLAIQASAVERMQELESIKQFVTAAEHTLKKQAVVDSI